MLVEPPCSIEVAAFYFKDEHIVNSIENVAATIFHGHPNIVLADSQWAFFPDQSYLITFGQDISIWNHLVAEEGAGAMPMRVVDTQSDAGRYHFPIRDMGVQLNDNGFSLTKEAGFVVCGIKHP